MACDTCLTSQNLTKCEKEDCTGIVCCDCVCKICYSTEFCKKCKKETDVCLETLLSYCKNCNICVHCYTSNLNIDKICDRCYPKCSL